MTKHKMKFSSEVASIVIETNKAIERAVKDSIGIPLTDYCILQQLLVYDTKVVSTVFQEFLLLRSNSVTCAVARLEEKGYVEKEVNEEDLRTFFLWITMKGEKASKEASTAIRNELKRLSWENPDDDRINWGMQVHASLFYKDKSNFKNVLTDANFLKINLEDEYFIVPGWVNGIKLLQQLWTTTIHRSFQMSLSEYRILAFLSESKEEVFSGDIADGVFLDKGAVSSFIKKLKQRGLITLEMSPKDRRYYSVVLTQAGKELEVSASAMLRKVTAQHFETLPQEMIDRQNQWHLDMYAALRRSVSHRSAFQHP